MLDGEGGEVLGLAFNLVLSRNRGRSLAFGSAQITDEYIVRFLFVRLHTRVTNRRFSRFITFKIKYPIFQCHENMYLNLYKREYLINQSNKGTVLKRSENIFVFYWPITHFFIKLAGVQYYLYCTYKFLFFQI